MKDVPVRAVANGIVDWKMRGVISIRAALCASSGNYGQLKSLAAKKNFRSFICPSLDDTR